MGTAKRECKCYAVSRSGGLAIVYNDTIVSRIFSLAGQRPPPRLHECTIFRACAGGRQQLTHGPAKAAVAGEWTAAHRAHADGVAAQPRRSDRRRGAPRRSAAGGGSQPVQTSKFNIQG